MNVIEQNTLSQLKNQITNNLPLYMKKSPFLLEELQIKNISSTPVALNISTGLPSDDAENVQLFFDKYKDIPIELANEESYWVHLAHIEFWEYMQLRWALKSPEDEATVRNRYFFGKERPLFRHGIARLWWYGYMTHDKTLDDPYHYTKIAFKDQDRARLLIETVNISRNRVALFATLDILHELDMEITQGKCSPVKDQRNNLLRPLIRFINEVGGVMIWDLLSEEEAKDKISGFINQLKEDKIIEVNKNSSVY